MGCWELESERESVNTLVSVPSDGAEEVVRSLICDNNRGVVKIGPSLLKQSKHTSQGLTSMLVHLSRTSGFFKRPTGSRFKVSLFVT